MVHVTSDAGDAAVRVTATVRRTPVTTQAAGYARRAATGARRMPAGPRRVLAAVAVIVVLLTATSLQWPVPRATVLGACVPENDLRVLTTAGLRDAVEAAAAGFTVDSPDDDCPDVRVTISTVSSDGHAQRRMADQWPDDDLRAAGPSPDVWLPESSAQVDLAREAIGADAARRLDLPDADAVRQASVAASPLVLAVPERAATTGPLTWRQVLDGPWSIPRADPRNSTTGLLTTYALYRAGTPQTAERILDRSQGGDDARSDLCRHRLSAVTPPVDAAYLVTAKDVDDYNRGRPLGDACQVAQPPPPVRRLRAVTVADAPALDVPCVPIQGSGWSDQVQRRLAGAFCEYLRDAGRPALQDHGLLPPDPGAATPALPRETADDVLRAWGSAQRPVRMLLAMDVSGSMRLPVAGADTPRIAVTKSAAAQAVTRRALGADDEVGLWEFATRLSGDRDYRELVPLAAATADHRTRMAGALEALEPTRQNTGLHDTIAAGIARLQQVPRRAAEFPPINLLVVLTDGENDDPGSMAVENIGQMLRDSDVQVSVIASVGANCRSFRSLVEQGLSCFDERKGGLAAAFDKALPTRLPAASPAGS
jgi:Ca-activated chloride channel family protein